MYFRKVFERAISANSSTEKITQFLKKWLDIEEKYGDFESLAIIRERISKAVQNV